MKINVYLEEESKLNCSEYGGVTFLYHLDTDIWVSNSLCNDLKKNYKF